jgi:predicted amidophosphoribosyltransferase
MLRRLRYVIPEMKKLLHALPHFAATNRQVNSLSSEVLQYKFVNVQEVHLYAFIFAFYKKSKVQKLLHALKYKGKRKSALLGFMFGQEMLASRQSSGRRSDFERSAASKKEANPWLQSKRPAGRRLFKATGIPWTGTMLERIRYTDTQTGKSKLERRENVKGVFMSKGF